MSDAPVLEVRDLAVEFATDRGRLRAVDGVGFAVRPGRTLAIVGESGCGKSVTALAVMGLLPGSARLSGTIRLLGRDLLGLPAEAWRARRGREMAMVFQEPMTSLNPAFTAGEQVAEALRVHEGLSSRAAFDRAVEMLAHVRIPDAARRARQYPHQLSGGMRQRVMIALALACNPEVLIADEPTTALDVTIQAQIIDLLRRLQAQMGMGIVMITHDLGVVAECCDRVVVMYAGRKVEEAPVAELFDRPLHPYTRALMASMPSMNAGRARLAEIPGMVPAPSELGRGCSFAPRCAYATGRCRAEAPPLEAHGADHVAACFEVERVAREPRPAAASPSRGPLRAAFDGTLA